MSDSSPQDVTALLLAWNAGDPTALARLTTVVHDELRRLARHYMRQERPGHTLQPTALVNEAYLRLVDVTRVRWQNRSHFFGVSARLMRQILVDLARERVRQNAAMELPRRSGRRRDSCRGPRRRLRRAGRSPVAAGGDRCAKSSGRGNAILRRHDGRGNRRSTCGVAGNRQAGLEPRKGVVEEAAHGMTPERWAAIERLYHEARTRPPDDRSSFLVAACGADADLLREVSTLLGHHDTNATFLETPAVEIAARTCVENATGHEPMPPAPNEVLGQYRLIKRLGRGGMGEVFLADETGSAGEWR